MPINYFYTLDYMLKVRSSLSSHIRPIPSLRNLLLDRGMSLGRLYRGEDIPYAFVVFAVTPVADVTTRDSDEVGRTRFREKALWRNVVPCYCRSLATVYTKRFHWVLTAERQNNPLVGLIFWLGEGPQARDVTS